MLRDRKIYVLWDEKLRAEVIQLHHNMPVREHGGQWKIVELVTRNFWWPEVTKKVKKYIESCNICQRNKNHTEALAGKLMSNTVLEKPWSHIIADFITKLPLAHEYNMILVVCNRITKMVHFVPTTKRTLVEGVARLFWDNIWKLHRLPESIIIDRGTQFTAEMIRELNQILKINTKLSTAYHLQTDGQIERINQELEQYLRMFIDHCQE